jgi:hypothetical protein
VPLVELPRLSEHVSGADLLRRRAHAAFVTAQSP